MFDQLRRFLESGGLGAFQLLAFILFLGVFAGAMVWLFDPRRRAELERLARLPLGDETGENPEDHDG